MNKELLVEETQRGVLISVKALPGSKTNALRGVVDGKLKISVSAPAEKGIANKVIVDFLAGKLQVRKSNIVIVSGQTAANKKIELIGLDRSKLMEVLLASDK